MIKLFGVVQHYGLRPVLRGIDMEVRKGEVAAIMGPNGSGKTTLLMAMAGLLTPQKGYVEIGGRRRRRTVEEELAIRRQVVYLPDQPWIPKERTGRDWLLAVGRLYGIDDERLLAHADGLFDLFHLQEKADAPISSYSTGQTKKLSLCSALIADAPVMLFDEPFSGGLDPSGLLAIKSVLQRFARDSERTVVLSSPVPELVEEVADRVLILREGKVAAFDTPEELRLQTGISGSLAEVYERLTNPRTVDSIENYFAEHGR